MPTVKEEKKVATISKNASFGRKNGAPLGPRVQVDAENAVETERRSARGPHSPPHSEPSRWGF